VNDCDGACLRKDVRPPFAFPDGGATLYDVRAKLVDDLYFPLHWAAPSGDGGAGVDARSPDALSPEFLFLDNPPSTPENTAIVLNVGQWHMHFDAADPAVYAARVEEYVHHLLRETSWGQERVRKSGVLHWRSLTPTEQSPFTRESLRHVGDLLAHYRRADNNVTAIWRRAGFPVIDVQPVAYHPDGAARRTLTHDSSHFHRNASDVVFGYVFAQICASLSVRRHAAVSRTSSSAQGESNMAGSPTVVISHQHFMLVEVLSSALFFAVLAVATRIRLRRRWMS
jgi:hypothetical protein